VLITIYANANAKQLHDLAKFGLYLGRAFQLTDDLLDLSGDFGGNKQWANDIYEGKRTVILGHLLRNAGIRDKKKILKILEKNRDEIVEDEVVFIMERMTHYGSVIYTQELTKQNKQKALEIFNKDLKFLKNEPYRAYIEKLMHFVVDRDY
jgi:geranylgeranyl diphosphate synthase type II